MAGAMDTTRDLSWLPARQVPVAATLAHADDLLTRVADLVYDYGTAPQAGLTLETVRRGNEVVVLVSEVTPVPRALPLYVADHLTTLRAAVEHTLYGEIEHANGAPLTPSEARAIEMPALDTAEKFDKWIEDRKRRGPQPLHSRGSALVNRIRILQPYQRHHSPQDHPMALLARYTNSMKHRSPAVASLRAKTSQLSFLADSRIQYFRAAGPIKVGDILARAPAELGALIDLRLDAILGLQRPGTEQWPSVMSELDDIHRWVRTQAVPILVAGTPDVTPLPAWYDTSKSHRDEVAAIATGRWASASDIHTRRIHAFGLRWQLPRIILAEAGTAPEVEAVNRWAAAIDEADLLSRFAQFEKCAGDLERTDALAAKMRDEAVAYDKRRSSLPSAE